MSCRTTQILIQFRQPPHMMFRGGPELPTTRIVLLLQLQPAEGIQLYFQTKIPDTEMQMRMTELNFTSMRVSRGASEAYERLLLDAMQGDASLFARSDEVEAAWSLVDPIQQTWDENPNDRNSTNPAVGADPRRGTDSARTAASGSMPVRCSPEVV